MADEKRKFLNNVRSFIEKECAEIGNLISHLSWTPDFILKGLSRVQCPLDGGHHVPREYLQKHLAVCKLRRQGLSKQDREFQLQDDDFFYEKAPACGKVVIDEGLLNRIIWNHCMENRQVHAGHRSLPVGSEDYMVSLSPQERLAVYDHCVQTLKAQGKMPRVEKDEVLTTDWEKIIKKDMLEGADKPKSHFELMAILRDQKRRRQTYRAKNVHVTKKSYTEIIREVILNQIEIMMPSKESESREEEKKKKERERAHNTPSEAQEGQRDWTSSRRSTSPGSRNHRQDRQGHSAWSRHRGRTRSRSPRWGQSRSRSRSPRRKRSRSLSRSRHRKRSRSRSRTTRYEQSRSRSRHRERSPNRSQRSLSRSRSPPKKKSKHKRHKQRTRSPSPKEAAGNMEREEGEVGSDEEQGYENRSKKKSSKHKKHKHKKHKSKPSTNVSDDEY